MFNRNRLHADISDTVIGEGSLFEGTLNSAAGMRIDGQVVGDIECAGDLLIGVSGSVRSRITARNVTVRGRVAGSISAQGKLTIAASGRIYGDLTTSVLTIEEGAIIEGECLVRRPHEQAQAATLGPFDLPLGGKAPPS
ncbi:polymer-forming cytoskeletal protein [Paenibacillus sp. IB182496]|uniref:Polymer-forming cytoskeletal protein n=1 Tax=Paenibacillus sabuli TaxID=2772509 RepID=A0A927BT38_9BACL|nr:polymer-forming cytoskeletal protein [Paenibacillus sabuli]MBD2844928.1 polymer-forming cytoskeletal protein [Paenibacillus sabuli]